ncbi:MAG: transposase [Methanophagales archaeon]|nr:transposase [Methanophagales archaeon]
MIKKSSLISFIRSYFSNFSGLFSPNYRGKVLLSEVAEAAEEIIRETCKELDVEIIDTAVNVDHV